MPFLDEIEAAQVLPRLSGGFDAPEPKATPTGGVLGAAFVNENEAIAALNVLSQERNFAPQPGYSPFDDPDLAKTTYIDNYGDRFIGVRSKAEANALRGRIDTELARARLIESAGAWGTVASMAAGVLAPSSLLPGGAVVRAGRIGERVGRSAVSVGLAAAGGTAVQEVALQSAQETRTLQESASAIAMSAAFGSFLGAGIASFPSRLAERVGADMTGAAVAPETHMIIPGSGRQSAGAAAVPGSDTTLVNRLGSGAFARASSFMTPLLRMQTSEADASRRAVSQLADPGGLRVNANTEAGGFQPMVPGGSVEVRSKAQIDSVLARYQQEVDAVYADYWKSAGGSDGIAGKIGIASNAVKQATLGGDGPLSPTQFFEMAGRAIRVDDGKSGDAFIQRAAAIQKRYQDEIFAVMPPELRPEIGSSPRFAGGYLPRIFNSRAIAAKATEFEDTIFRNMQADQERKALLQGQAESASSELAALQKREGQISGRLETVSRRQSDAQSRIDEMGMVSRKGQARLESADARVAELEKDIGDLEAEYRAAVADRDYSKRDLKALEKELNALRRDRDGALRRAAKQPKGAPVSYDEIPTAPDARQFVDYVTGKRGAPRAPTFLRWIIANGGIKRDGDVAGMFGGKAPRGLFRPDGKSLEDLGQAYAEHIGVENYRSDAPGYRFETAEMRDMIDQAIGGKDPANWRDSFSMELRQRVELHEIAQETAEDMRRAGLDPDNRSAVMSYMRGENPADAIGKPVGPQLGWDNDVSGVTDDMLEQIPIDPVEMFRGVDNLTAATQGTLKRSERIVASLRSKIASRETTMGRQSARQGEALANAKGARARIDTLLDRAELYASMDKTLADELQQLTKAKEDVRGKLEKIVTEWEGDTVREAKSSLKRVAAQAEERQQAIAAGTYKGKGERLTGADADVDKAIGGILKSDRHLSDAELRTQARDVVQNMMASPEGRLPYEWGETATKQARSAGNMAEDVNVPFLKERRFPVPDGEMLDVLNNDIRAVFHAYAHSMVPQAEMQRMFGDVRGSAIIRNIQEEYGARIAGVDGSEKILAIREKDGAAAAIAAAEKERMSLQKDMNDDIRDFDAMRDRLLGVYGLPTDPQSMFYRGAKVAQQINFLSKMGMMVVSSVADAGGIIIKNGLGSTFDALGGALARFSKDPEIARVAKLERNILEDAGVGLEYVLGSRALSFAEITTDYGRGSKFERAMQSATAGYSYLNLSRQWDSSMQTIAGVATIRRIMRNAEHWSANGSLNKGEAEWMASVNLGLEQARRIWSAAAAGEGERVKGVLIPEGRTWADREAYDAMRFAIKQATDSTVIKPGQDRPLWMSTTTGKVIGQFRSFTIAAHQRILLSGLQQADANMAQGVVTMVGLGVLSVALSDLAREGGFKQRDPGEWFVEGFDRSGLAGWLMEPNNLAEKLSGQQFGLRPLAGQQPAAKSLNQSKADAVLGPTLGFIGDATRIIGAPLKGEVTRGDLRAVRNQIPGQNLFWARGAFNKMHESVEKAAGVYEPPKATKH